MKGARRIGAFLIAAFAAPSAAPELADEAAVDDRPLEAGSIDACADAEHGDCPRGLRAKADQPAEATAHAAN
jgi:hypothetical protein